MPISPLSYAIWVTGTVLEFFCCYLLWHHGLLRRLPFLSSYLCLVAIGDLSYWWILHSDIARPPTLHAVYWGSEAVLVAARGLAIMELCRQILRPYHGVWALSRVIFAFLAVMLTATAIMQAWGERAWIRSLVLSLDRSVELITVAVIITLLTVCRSYEVPIPRLFLFLLIGFGAYAAIQIVNTSFSQQFPERFRKIWGVVDPAAYVGSVLLWSWALWKRLPAEQPQPALLEAGTYDALVPQMNQRLRELNHRLEEMFRG